MFKSETDVRAVIQPIIDKYKMADSKLNQSKFKDDTEYTLKHLPEFYPAYKTLVEQSWRVRIHAEVGAFPERLFASRAPNMEEKEYKYLRENYKQTTLPVFVDYLSSNTRCFNDGNWDIRYQEEADYLKKSNATFYDYVEKGIKTMTSLENFVKFLLPSYKAIDPNGIVAVRPAEIPTIQVGDTMIVDDTRLPEPQPYYYPVMRCLSDPKHDHDYVIVESAEKSPVEYGGQKNAMKGHIFEVYDQENIYIVKQVGKFQDYIFEISLFFKHNQGYVPASRLMGMPKVSGESLVWQSPFLFACDLLDLALMNKNYLQCSQANVLFPYRVMLGSKCRHKHTFANGQIQPCSDGYIFNPETATDMQCPKCNGMGLVNRVSPLGQMLLYPEDVFSQGESNVSVRPYEVIDPATASSEFVLKVIDADILKAYDVLKIRPASQAQGAGIGADGTATGAIMDVKAQMQSAKLFSDQIFYIYEFLLESIGLQRYGAEFKKPVVSYPVTCDFYTEGDYISLISQLQNAKVPPAILENIFKKYLRALYYNESITANVFELIKSTDRLFILNSEQAQFKEKLGQVEKWEIVLHDSATIFIDQLIAENKDAEMCAVDDCSKGFFALPFDQQQEMLIAKAKEKADQIKGPKVIDMNAGA